MFPFVPPQNRPFDTATAMTSCGVCGWTAALCSMVAFGSFGVPIKGEASRAVDVDPLVFQSYKTGMCLLTCWLVLIYGTMKGDRNICRSRPNSGTVGTGCVWKYWAFFCGNVETSWRRKSSSLVFVVSSRPSKTSSLCIRNCFPPQSFVTIVDFLTVCMSFWPFGTLYTIHSRQIRTSSSHLGVS